MRELYQPESDFLNLCLNDEIVLDGSAFGVENIRRLLKFVDDAVQSNRDWAAFLIAGLRFDSDEIRAALLRAAQDEDADTRDEAIVGLARRDRVAATAILRSLLEQEVGVVLLEAATIVGDSGLIPALYALRGRTNANDAFRGQLERAITACTAGIGIDDIGLELTFLDGLSDV